MAARQTFTLEQSILRALGNAVEAKSWQPPDDGIKEAYSILRRIRRTEQQMLENLLKHPQTPTTLLIKIAEDVAPNEKLLLSCTRSLMKRSKKDDVAAAFISGLLADLPDEV